MKRNNHYDVIILGGGLAGATLARHLTLSQPDLKLLVLEANQFPVPEAKFKVGESTVDIAGYYLRKVLRLESYIEKNQLPKYGLRFFMPNGDNSDISTRLEVGNCKRPDSKSYQIDRGKFENDLHDMLLADGVEFLSGCRVQDVDLHPETKKVTYTNNGATEAATARWVIDASGFRQLIKQKLGLQKPVGLSHCSAWFRVETTISVNDVSDHKEWLGRVPQTARELSTSHLMGKGYWVWIIPLSSGCTSIGIVTDPRYHPLETYGTLEDAMQWLHKHEPQMARLVDTLQDKVMDFKRLANFAYNCKKVFSADRWAMTGIAGVFTDPFYSPGSDFISFANTFIDNLIREDLAGKDISNSVMMAEQMFFNGYEVLLATIQGQYEIFGNPLVMSNKLIWDATSAWTGISLVFCNGYFTDGDLLAKVGPDLMTISKLHLTMQKLFLEWSRKEHAHPSRRTIIVDTYPNFMNKLQTRLTQTMDKTGVIEAIKHNRNILCTLAVSMFEKMGDGDIQSSSLWEIVKEHEPIDGIADQAQMLLYDYAMEQMQEPEEVMG